MATLLDNPETQLREESDEKLDTPWLVVVYDDPVNLMSYVTMVFQLVVKLPKEEAERKMWEVHTKGRSVVWAGPREPAEFIAQQLQLYGLQTRMERSSLHD
jgi:ATP-dependent Clp protease adaptor protein ClpS